MIVSRVNISGVNAVATVKKTITAGMIGAQVQLEYTDPVWSDLHKTVVFKGEVTKDVVTDADIIAIPAEVVATHGTLLRVGVYGVDAENNIVIPTIWADLGVVRDSAQSSGDTTTDPSLPVWAQLQAKIGNLDDLDTTARDNLVAAVNEALTKGGGGGGAGIEVSGATVGQTIRIAAVDENGEPTAWEATDFPESTNDSDALEALAECGIITPAYQDGVFYTDTDGAIYVL